MLEVILDNSDRVISLISSFSLKNLDVIGRFFIENRPHFVLQLCSRKWHFIIRKHDPGNLSGDEIVASKNRLNLIADRPKSELNRRCDIQVELIGLRDPH